MIHRLQGKYGEVFTIASGGLWLPGCYDSERAAKYAFRFRCPELQRLQDKVNEMQPDPDLRVITFEMLQDLRKTMKAQKI